MELKKPAYWLLCGGQKGIVIQIYNAKGQLPEIRTFLKQKTRRHSSPCEPILFKVLRKSGSRREREQREMNGPPQKSHSQSSFKKASMMKLFDSLMQLRVSYEKSRQTTFTSLWIRCQRHVLSRWFKWHKMTIFAYPKSTKSWTEVLKKLELKNDAH